MYVDDDKRAAFSKMCTDFGMEMGLDEDNAKLAIILAPDGLMKRQKLQKVCTFMRVRCHLVYSAFALIFAHMHAILTLFTQ